jgi:uncharacterized protein YcfL
MKKVLFVFAIATALVACGGNASNSATTDSTAVDSTKVDSAAVAADTTAVVDSTKK